MKRIILLVTLAILSTSLCWAETIYLKNGKKITGKIVEQDDQQLKVDVSGVKITYFKDEIDKVEGAAASAEVPTNNPAPPLPSNETPAPISTPPSSSTPAPAPPANLPAAVPTLSAPLPVAAITETTSSSKREKILSLIDVSGTRESMDAMFTQIISEAPPEEATKLKGVFNLDEIIERFIPVYDKYFTEEDLTELITFYKSPVGKKLIKVTPQLMEDSMTVSVQYFRERMPEPPAEKPAADTGTGADNAAPMTP